MGLSFVMYPLVYQQVTLNIRFKAQRKFKKGGSTGYEEIVAPSPPYGPNTLYTA